METKFEYATRNRLRFQTVRGDIDVEALWSVPLTSTKDGFNLDAIAIAQDALMGLKSKSFVAPKVGADEVNEVKMDIIKYIIATKLSEETQARNAAAIKARKETLLSALADRQTDAVRSMSEEELRAELAKLS